MAGWLDELWEAVCRKAARPIPGVLLDGRGIATVAREVFGEFLEGGGSPEGTPQAMMTVLGQPAQKEALKHVAGRRSGEGDADLLRDPEKKYWERNPKMPELVERGGEGELTSGEWGIAEPVMWKRAAPIYRRLRINETDARDVYGETMGDFLKARPDLKGCPFLEMLVFEELPRLFAVVAERRAISWVRKQTTLKNQPNQTGLSMDDPDLGLAEPRSLEDPDPLANVTFDRIRERCGEALEDFEWHVVEALFVEGSQTRDELVMEDWIVEEMGVDLGASRSTKLRRLNGVIAEALGKLGRAIETTDL
ncbi:MAG: hypothetical protein ACSHYF_16200 [Verrucomicrobiaceae bacterium]